MMFWSLPLLNGIYKNKFIVSCFFVRNYIKLSLSFFISLQLCLARLATAAHHVCRIAPAHGTPITGREQTICHPCSKMAGPGIFRRHYMALPATPPPGDSRWRFAISKQWTKIHYLTLRQFLPRQRIVTGSLALCSFSVECKDFYFSILPSHALLLGFPHIRTCLFKLCCSGMGSYLLRKV